MFFAPILHLTARAPLAPSSSLRRPTASFVAVAPPRTGTGSPTHTRSHPAIDKTDGPLLLHRVFSVQHTSAFDPIHGIYPQTLCSSSGEDGESPVTIFKLELRCMEEEP